MRLGIGAMAIAAVVAMSCATAAEPELRVTVTEVELLGLIDVVEIVPLTGAALINSVAGELHVVHSLSPADAEADIDAEAAQREAVYESMLPQSHAAHGDGDIRVAWLTDATERYRHGVLGDRLEAASVRVRDAEGAEFVLDSGDDAVFEDLVPRLADLDGDGRDEIIVVKSYLDRGAALAVVGLRDTGLEVLAETPPIGRPNRWLNPIGAADFDGDGAMEIAYVEMPHIGGRLMIWEWRDGRLEREHAEAGFSNHAIGSTELGLSAIADFDGDGLMDLAVPGSRRDRLYLLSLAEGRFRELADIALDGTVATAIAPVGGGLVFGLEDGRLMAVRPTLP